MTTRTSKPPARAAARSALALATLLLVAVKQAPAARPPAAGKPGAAARKATGLEKEARAFIEAVAPLVLAAARVEAEASWLAATDVTAEHTAARAGAARAATAVAGTRSLIEKGRAFLAREKELDELTARQLRKLLLAAAEAPGTIPDVVRARAEAETRQAEILDRYTFCLQPKPGAAGACARPTTANEIDAVLLRSRDLGERQRVWTASKEIGKALRPGLVELQRLRNQVAREMGHASFFALRVAPYDMGVDELMALLDATLATTQPLYQALHCWAKGALAKRYGRPVPRMLPAHWVGNRWAQRWPGLVEDVPLEGYFKGAKPETLVQSAERFYTSLGFAPLPETFWKRSDLYPVGAGQTRKKAPQASAWHIDREQDVRASMNVEANEQWFGTAHHELGHIYYDLGYSRPEVPPLLREGANRAFHEAVGELARLASAQPPYLRKIGVLPTTVTPDANRWLLQSALDAIVFLPFSAGTMAHFERDLYEQDLPPAEWQKRWWEYAARFQGVQPPAPRPDDGCDACTKTHLSEDPATYYDYALATLIKFQLHEHICAKILKQDVHACDYSGQKAVGDFLRGILSAGATRDWRGLIKEATGEDIGPRALGAFYAPLVEELAKQNGERECTWD